ncbi:hypothetical protein GIB67_000587 [Kingdonia uniflora]|uniref:Uncharacterized protein n=1 Tax=Kingdonia uniflora TaxID=39325 RepID=A0A7J7P2M6_9MAGN|nr:hypothetical protein GIB67_000587 [Kingdonia uniflora]
MLRLQEVRAIYEGRSDDRVVWILGFLILPCFNDGPIVRFSPTITAMVEPERSQSLKFPRIVESIHLFPKLQGWRMTSFKRRQIMTFTKFFANPKLLVIAMKPSETDMPQGLVQEAMVLPGKGLEVVKDLMVDNDVEVNFKAISLEYGGDLLETMVVEEVTKIDIVFFNQEEVVGETYQASADQTTAVFVEKQTLEVKKTKDEASQVTYLFFAEVVQTEVVIFYQGEDVGEASQNKKSKDEVEQNKEEVVEGKDDDDGN